MFELLTTAEMADADRLAIAGGAAGSELMESAGRAVAEAVAARHPSGSRVVVVAGPGNNGGDGFVAARLLAERGARVEVILLGEIGRLKGDAALAAKKWTAPLAAAEPRTLAGADVVIDALFGAGLDRPVEGTARALIEAINAGKAPVYAVDLPTASTARRARSSVLRSRPPIRSPFFVKSLGTSCCRAGSTAALFPSPTSAFRRRCWRRSRPRHSRTFRRCGAGFSCAAKRGP